MLYSVNIYTYIRLHVGSQADQADHVAPIPYSTGRWQRRFSASRSEGSAELCAESLKNEVCKARGGGRCVFVFEPIDLHATPFWLKAFHVTHQMYIAHRAIASVMQRC